LSARRGLRRQEKEKRKEDEGKSFLAHGRLASSLFGNERMANLSGVRLGFKSIVHPFFRFKA
jgi:hypothetical protein